MARPLSLGQLATLACLLEVTTPKPGNVHRGADFEDVGFFDFAASAVAIAPAIDAAAAGAGLGSAVLQAISDARHLIDSNTYLGTILLLVPLAKVPREESLSSGVERVLSQLMPVDARDVYAGIRLARPGGLGQVAAADVSGEPPDNLLAAMELAAPRDLVARQYTNGFHEVLDIARPWLIAGLSAGWNLQQSILHTYVQLLAREPDSLIVRKCGPEVGARASQQAQRVLDAGSPDSEDYQRALGDLDFWLRSDGHRRNPGTAADLVAAALFAALRDEQIPWPLCYSHRPDTADRPHTDTP